MTEQDWLIIIDFTSDMLYMLVAWLSGLVLGYILGFKNGSM